MVPLSLPRPRTKRRSSGISPARASRSPPRGSTGSRRGLPRVGLGVDDHNLRAATPCLRLGYEDTGCRYLDHYHHLDDHGIRREVAGPCRFLIKPLRARTLR
ncbi:hypothetical protein GCM10009560_72380 [Nonomuraea longicatena]|uniref:Uncharacterized protein n=1 Tax=Nonomuraea longicatena TaxID=83682 RepID=A0ABN1R3V9_9ACTN